MSMGKELIRIGPHTHRLAGDQGSADWLPAVPVASTPRHRAASWPRRGELRMLLVAAADTFKQKRESTELGTLLCT